MAEYIDKQAAIKTIRTYFESLPWNGLATTVADDCEKLLNDIPSCDVLEKVKGKWVGCEENKNVWFPIYRCSECFGINAGASTFCPNCGAYMRGKKDGSY